MLPSPSPVAGSASEASHFRGHLCVHSRCGPVTRSPPDAMALSMGFRCLVSLLSAIQATGLLAVPRAGLSPAERASLCWTHNRACEFPRTRLSSDSCRECLFRRPSAVDGLMTSPASDQRFAFPCRHQPEPGRDLFPLV